MRVRQVAYQSPICSLPIELLSYIFVLGTHSPLDSLEDGTEAQEQLLFNTESVETPLIFSAVCRHWRNVALGTASLWTNICVTVGSIEITRTGQKKGLNLSHVTSCLSLSKKCPLSILLDARDIDWDYDEPEIPAPFEYSDYVPPFSEDDMEAALSLLLPHMSRWRSIDILTDTWAPMHTALFMLNKPLSAWGAPLLESLTLMRCNDYISYSPQFQPAHMKSPELFSSVDTLTSDCRHLLPRLRNLTLRGVHVDWSGLAHFLNGSLTSLELSSHSLDVRPTRSAFCDVLSNCSRLTSLIISGSGFIPPNNEGLLLKAGSHISNDKMQPIPLPLLEELILGYRSPHDGRDILAMLHVPNIRHLSLEDASYPGDIDEIEADALLLAIAGCRQSAQTNEVDLSSLPYPQLNPKLTSIVPESSPPFSALQKVVLKRLRAHPEAIRKFLVSVPHLQSLELHAMPKLMDAVHAMLPYGRSPCSPRCLPCPDLLELCLKGGKLSAEELGFITKDLLVGRSKGGAMGLQRLDIHLADHIESSVHELGGLSLHISSLPLDEMEDTADTGTTDSQLNEAFQYGGIFNDPIFDAQYSPMLPH